MSNNNECERLTCLFRNFRGTRACRGLKKLPSHQSRNPCKEILGTSLRHSRNSSEISRELPSENSTIYRFKSFSCRIPQIEPLCSGRSSFGALSITLTSSPQLYLKLKSTPVVICAELLASRTVAAAT